MWATQQLYGHPSTRRSQERRLAVAVAASRPRAPTQCGAPWQRDHVCVRRRATHAVIQMLPDGRGGWECSAESASLAAPAPAGAGAASGQLLLLLLLPVANSTARTKQNRCECDLGTLADTTKQLPTRFLCQAVLGPDSGAKGVCTQQFHPSIPALGSEWLYLPLIHNLGTHSPRKRKLHLIAPSQIKIHQITISLSTCVSGSQTKTQNSSCCQRPSTRVSGRPWVSAVCS